LQSRNRVQRTAERPSRQNKTKKINQINDFCFLLFVFVEAGGNRKQKEGGRE
jgi:hypothetical protein